MRQLNFLLFGILLFSLMTRTNIAISFISSSLIIFISAFNFFRDKKRYLQTIQAFFKTQSKLLISLVLFFGWLVFSSAVFSAYGSLSENLYSWFQVLRFPIVLWLAVINCLFLQGNSQEITQVVFFSMLISLIFIIFFAPIIKYYQIHQFSSLALYLRFKYIGPLVIILPFIVLNFYQTDHVMKRIAYLLLILLSYLFIAFTGSRGGLLASTIGIFATIICYYQSRQLQKIKLIKNIFAIFFILLLSAFIAYKTIPRFHGKVDSTLSNIQSLSIDKLTSWRVYLLKTRYPLIMNSASHYIYGIGYSDAVYQKYLRAHHAPKFPGSIIDGEFQYAHDEPIIVRILYSSGMIGVILFLINFWYFIRLNWVDYSRNQSIYSIAMFAFCLAYIMVFCQLEVVLIDLFMVFNLITIARQMHVNEKDDLVKIA